MITPSELDRRTFLRRFGALAGCFVARASLPFRPAGLEAATVSGFTFPQGVASGDPTPETVVLWTRVQVADGAEAPVPLRAQVSRSAGFREVLVDRSMTVGSESDHTLRLLVDGLEAGERYFYRFVAPDGTTSETGRTFTAPDPDDPAPVRLAMVSCQHHQLGYMTPYRRMIHEDEARDADDQIRLVLHLGDFIYEEVWYPEEQATFLRRRVRDTIRFPHGGRTGTLRYPVSLDDYRYLYKAYLSDPDLRAARARWPFVCTWDDHEFSNNSWQSQEMYEGSGRPAQSRKVAANQAWFEYIPAFLTGNPGVEGVSQRARDFQSVEVHDTPIERFDDEYRSLNHDNRAAIESLVIYRSLRWGRNVELVVTDTRSFRSPPVPPAEISAVLDSGLFWIHPRRMMQVLDAGRHADGGSPPEHLRFGDRLVENPNRERPTGTALGTEQKQWWKETLAASDATWTLWGNSYGTMSRRADFQNLPGEMAALWPDDGYGVYGNDDWECYDSERAELLRFVREEGIGSFVSLSGDRHNFTAGYLSGSLEPDGYDPVGVEFGVSSLATPTSFEAFEYVLEQRPELEPLYIERRGEDEDPVPVINLLFTHGVRAALEYSATGDLSAALARTNPEVAPHLPFLDMSSHGFATVLVTPDALETEFVGMDRPVESVEDPEGPPVKYRLVHRVAAWEGGERPSLQRIRTEGDLPFPVRDRGAD